MGYHGSHNWVARGWRNGAFAMYRETRTMRVAKAECQSQANYAATQTCLVCLNIGGHTDTCIRTVAEYADAIRDGMAKMAPIVATAARQMGQLLKSFTAARPCDCPTPTHRMSCGVGAVPEVVSK